MRLRERRVEELELILRALFDRVAFFERPRRGLVVARERGIGFVGNTLGKHGEIGDSDERVSASHVMIEKAQGFPRLKALEPERGARKLNRHRVEVNARDTVRDDLAKTAPEVAVPRARLEADRRERLGEVPGGREKKVTGTARRIDHRDRKDRLFRLLGRGAQFFPDDRVKRALDKYLHETVGRVVAAGCLPGVARRGTSLRVDADKTKGTRGKVDHRYELEEAFVDGAELLGIHVLVVDEDA